LKQIELISRAKDARRWQHELAARLQAAGYGLLVTYIDAPEPEGRALDRSLALTRRGPSLADNAGPLGATAGERPDLAIDLTGRASGAPSEILRVSLCGESSVPTGLARLLANGLDAEILISLAGQPVARAVPMIDDRLWLGRIGNSVLGAMITLIIATVDRYFSLGLEPLDVPRRSWKPAGLTGAYVRSFATGISARMTRRLMGRPDAPWKIAYRLIDGPGVAETGRLDGAPFIALPDDGKRFYADPFVIAHDGKLYLFVEEFPYATGKGVISVSELDASGRFGTPRVVLEAPHHLSYPQIVAHGGELYMLPESSGGDELVLYRATRFPDGWERDTVLLSGVNINDATLLERDGRFWLVGTSRIGTASASDTMVVYGASSLRGPWLAHPLNPILIDRVAARPGGAFIRQDGRLFLPVQDGSATYGGGLGLTELLRLDDRQVKWGEVRPITPGAAWHCKGIHTLNRAGRLEVIDSVH